MNDLTKNDLKMIFSPHQRLEAELDHVYHKYDGAPLLADTAARICKGMERAEDVELIMFIQQMSMKKDGLTTLCKRIMEEYADNYGTEAMHRIGKREGLYSEEEALVVEKSCYKFFDRRHLDIDDILCSKPFAPVSKPRKIQRDVVYWLEECRDAFDYKSALALLVACCRYPFARKLEDREFQMLDQLKVFKDFFGCVRKMRAKMEREESTKIVSTAVSRKIFDDLRFCREKKSFILIEGEARRGKTFALKNWCDQNFGRVFYVALEQGGDDGTFFRSIARAMGISTVKVKNIGNLRSLIQETLYDSKMMIVFDEAHYAWSLDAKPSRPPRRIDWIRTALVDKGIPVALISTPQFDRQFEIYRERIGWNDAQFIGRLGLRTSLPEKLHDVEIQQVIGHFFPDIEAALSEMILGCVIASNGYLQVIDRIKQRAQYFAERERRKSVLKRDIMAAVKEFIPVKRKSSAKPVNDPCNDDAGPRHEEPIADMDFPQRDSGMSPVNRSMEPVSERMHAETV
ncbi:ATP-binding protein [Oscillatoria laete-virens NRMC-F 0139]|nr:ATP-binding protein [Oscillatoria laete-virens]MDL5055336.1 ATP-binding protein [Oscillatoria laete-virens NRMC-F 0139]